MSIRDFATHIGLGEFVDKINDMRYLKPFVICGNYNFNDCDIFISIYIYVESRKATWIQEDLHSLKYNCIVF